MEKSRDVLYPAKSNATDSLVQDQRQAVQESAPVHLVERGTALEDVLLLAPVQIRMQSISAVKLFVRVVRLRNWNAIMHRHQDVCSRATVRMDTVWSTAYADYSVNARVEIEPRT